jgi:glycine hydroxymethyltransferase
VRPKLITVGGSLNLFPHPVQRIREIADAVGAYVLFDAAHVCGLIAGGAWPNPLDSGAHMMTMSTYKSLGGPPGGLVVTNDEELAQRTEKIAYPGLTANFDAGKTAALAMTLVDWRSVGSRYASAMVATSRQLANELASRGLPLFASEQGGTDSHQFALLAHNYGGGQAAARRLRAANILTCGIGLPADEVPGDVNGLRIGTPEIVRLGMTPADMPILASFVARGLDASAGATTTSLALEVTKWRQQFRSIHYTHRQP